MNSPDHHKPRMYGDLAHLWPLLSPPEDYAEEAVSWRNILREKLGDGRHEILALGVGGGHHLSHLTADFQATAADISEEMLALSRRLNPSVEHHVGDMRTLRVDRRFRAVLIHDAIGYMLTTDDLHAAFTNAAAHLRPGGVLILAPDFFRENFVDPHIYHTTREADGIQLTYFEYDYDPDPSDTTTESLMFFLIREGGKVRVERDHHTLGLFSRQIWLDELGRAGFTAELRPDEVRPSREGTPLLVGTLPV